MQTQGERERNGKRGAVSLFWRYLKLFRYPWSRPSAGENLLGWLTSGYVS